MKYFLSLFIVACIGLSTTAFIDADSKADEVAGIQFSSMSLDEAKALAKKENKLIFIDVYTTWCAPCKLMAKRVFVDEELGEIYNEQFINLKLDAEKSEDGKFVSRSYRVQGYPTLLFINNKGKLMKRTIGVQDKAAMLRLASSLN